MNKKNRYIFPLTLLTLVGLWVVANWFKLLIAVAIIFVALTYYSYTQNNAQLSCTQYGANYDKQLTIKQDASNAEYAGQAAQYLSTLENASFGTLYKYKSGVCYRNLTTDTTYTYRNSASSTQTFTSEIDNAYTGESLYGCTITTTADGVNTQSSTCIDYDKAYDRLFSNVYGI